MFKLINMSICICLCVFLFLVASMWPTTESVLISLLLYNIARREITITACLPFVY